MIVLTFGAIFKYLRLFTSELHKNKKKQNRFRRKSDLRKNSRFTFVFSQL